MEEKKGQNTLYLVIGIATLVVAIIGATFAYFSAQASSTGEIQGGTNDVGASLDLTVNRVLFGADDDANYNNLVPAQLTLSNDGIASVVNNKCVANGYTGCHLYKITASSDQTLQAADLLLQSFKTESVTDTSAWKFVVFTADEATGDDGTTYTVKSLVTGTEAAQDFATSDATKDTPNGYNIHKNEQGISAGMTADQTYTYYLLVYLADNDNIQNPTAEDTQNQQYSATGTYSGSVVLNAAGGKVVANFNASIGG